MPSRLEPEHLAEWREKYGRARMAFMTGTMSRIEAGDVLRNLGYRADALRVELLEFERAKAEYGRTKNLR